MQEHKGGHKIPEKVKPFKQLILDRLMVFQDIGTIIAHLNNDNPGLNLTHDDVKAFTAGPFPGIVKKRRERMQDEMEITSTEWCLMRLNGIATDPETPATQVMTAIRLRGQLLGKGQDEKSLEEELGYG